ncbi:MAG: ATP-binding cassette, subfamily bacterial [Acidimicrobiaceae bacterium]|jgi:putative ABC transport system ATP-binding protein|nr:ATP-binding cassette, subfamily bacterial [Acidimicrobiaceae bacterium]
MGASHRLSTIDVLRRGWRSSPELRAGAGVTLLLALVSAGGRVVVPVLVQQMLDKGLHQGVGGAVFWSMAAGGVLAVVVTGVAAAATRTRMARAGESALCALRTRAFRHIHRLSLATQTDERRGVLVSRVTSDIETMSHFLSWAGVAWLVNIAVMAVVLGVMAVYDWRLTLVALVVVVPMGVVLSMVQRRLAVAYDTVRARIADMFAAVSEAVLGHHVIRSYGAQRQSTERLESSIEASRKANVRAGVISAFLFPSGDVFSVLTVAAVLVLGVWLGPAGGLSVGKLVAFLFLTSLFLEPVAEFTEIVDNTQTAVAGWRKVLDVLDTPVEVIDPDPGVTLPAGPPAIEVQGVSFGYRDAPVLHDVWATVPAGAQAAVVGATGSGKTTLAKLLTRLADPDEGRIVIGGVDLRDVAPSSLRTSVVMVPQEGFLFDTTVLENVRFGRPAADDDDVRAAFAELGLESWVDALPRGLHTRVGQRGDSLSVGERQLVSLARAYVANPTCLILDEATSAVDPATEVRISRAVESLSRGRTSVTIAHRLATAERAQLVLVMDGGRLVEQGTHGELVRLGGVYAAMHRRWSSGIEAETAVQAR